MDAKVSKKPKSKHVASRSFSDPWANLAAAILHSGIACHDEFFLKSSWAKDLVDLVDMATVRDDNKNKREHGVSL